MAAYRWRRNESRQQRIMAAWHGSRNQLIAAAIENNGAASRNHGSIAAWRRKDKHRQ